MYIFKFNEVILGICDEDHLKECANEVYNIAFNCNAEDKVVIYYFEPNVIDDECSYTTYEFDEYYEDGKYIGLRLAGLGGIIDVSLGIKIIKED